MDSREFQNLVRAALKELPPQFGNALSNVDIVIEDMPDMQTAKELGLSSRGRLLGLYQGVPLKKRTHYYAMLAPDKITLYKANLERSCRQKGVDIYGEIKHTLQHEIAHHYGISDKRLRDLDVY